MFKRLAIIGELKPITPSAASSRSLSLYTESGKPVVAANGNPVSLDYDPENFVYFRCRAISADVPNGNGDLFPESELVKSYKSFIGVGLYKDHDSDSVDKSIGKVLWAEWIPEGKYVECYCSVDRKLAPDMARRVEMGEASTVSMGCMVGEAVCGVEGCGNVAHNQAELCFVPGTKITIGDGTSVCIEDVHVGDEVVTASGDLSHVTQTFKRNFDGDLVVLKIETKQDRMYATPNHPFQVFKAVAIPGRTLLLPPKFTNAEDIRVGDFVFSPTINYDKQSGLTPEQMRWLGWYASEGHVAGESSNNGKAYVVGFSLGNHEPQFAEEICALSESAFGRRPRVYPRRGPNRTGMSINLSCRSASEFAVRHVGRGAKTKRLSRDVMSASVEAQKEFLASYILGDGYVKHGKSLRNRGLGTDTISIATASPYMADQLCAIAERCGISARKYKVKQSAGPAKRAAGQTIDSVLYNIYLRPSDLDKISGNLSRYFILKPSKHSSGRGRVQYDSGWISRVTEVDRERYSGAVHNFEVADQHTYVANGVAVHNCEHMTPGRGIKGKRYAGDKVAYEVNKILQFTELSLVTVPADATARIFEVFAKLKSGDLTLDDFRAAIREELRFVLAENGSDQVSSSTSTNIGDETHTGPTSTSGSAPSAAEAKMPEAVARIQKETEKKMKLNISYLRGSNLANSFFVAKQNGAEYRVAVAEVMPIRVQEAILAREAGVSTPEQVIEDLTAKCESLSSFKAWAKKRRKKNRRALEKMEPVQHDKVEPERPETPAEEKKEAGADGTAVEADAQPAPSAAPADMPAGSGNDVMNPPGQSPDPVMDQGEPGYGQTEPATGNPAQDVDVSELEDAIHELQRRLDEKMTQSRSRQPQKTATVVQRDLTNRREQGEVSHDSASRYAPDNKQGNADATQEVAATHSDEDGDRDQGVLSKDPMSGYKPAYPVKMPGGMKAKEEKSYRDEGVLSTAPMSKYAPAKVKAARDTKDGKLTATAGSDAVWSWNAKEIEKPPKPAKLQQAAPPVVSWSEREMHDEQTKLDSGSHNSPVKKYFGRLPGKGPGEAPKAMDLKSGIDPEKETLRRENAALKEKERLQQLANKIYEIVKALREKNVLTAERENEVIDLLGSSFTDLATLDSVASIMDKLSASAEAVPAEASAAADEVEVGNVVPQVFEPITQTEDAISQMSRIWNL